MFFRICTLLSVLAINQAAICGIEGGVQAGAFHAKCSVGVKVAMYIMC